MPDEQNTDTPWDYRTVFALLNEVGIIAQLSRASLEARNPDGLSMPQFSVLNHLVRLGDTPSPLKLAKAFQQPKTTMTHTLATLEKRGLIEMRPNPEDGRSKLVHLTEAGREAREIANNVMTKDMARLAKDVGIEKFAQVMPVLTEVRQRLDSYRDTS